MPTKTLYFDESGFTGYNLLDGAQPIFAIASTDVDDEAAERILRASFPNYRGSEFKFTNIWRSNNKTGLVEFGRRLGALENHAVTWMIDKKFAVLAKMVDYLVEPLFTNSGYDFYAEGFCVKYANYVHFGLVHFASPELYDALVVAYQKFSRDPSPVPLRRLRARLRIMAASSEEPVRIFIEHMALGADHFTCHNDLNTFHGSGELQVTSMLSVLAYWRRHCSDDFSVVHDASSNFLRRADVWTRITNNNVPPQMHPLADGTFVQFPLRVASTTPVNSKDHYAIQFCDILAGLASRHVDTRLDADDRRLVDDVIAAGLHAIDYGGIQPAHVFPDRSLPRRRSGPDAVDKMTRIIFGPHNN